MMLEARIILCVREPDILEKIFFPENWGNGSKIGFFGFKEKFRHKFSLNLFYNKNLCFWVPAQIPYLGKTLFLRYRPNCSQPIRLQDFQINYFSRTNRWNSLIFACRYKFKKIRIKIFEWAWSKMGVANLVLGL